MTPYLGRSPRYISHFNDSILNSYIIEISASIYKYQINILIRHHKYMASRGQFEEWFLAKYEENLNNTNIKWPPQFKKFLDRLLPREISGARRMNAFVATKYNCPLTKAGYLCSVFTCNFKAAAHASTKSIENDKEYETYYSYVYWPKDGESLKINGWWNRT
jgi:hypothetical protein